MNKKTVTSLIWWIVGGALVGSCIGFLGHSSILPESVASTLPGLTIKVCFGLMLLIIYLLCFWGAMQPAMNRHIDEEGESVTGVIEEVKVLSRPDQINADEWEKLARFAFIVSYEVGEKKYRKEFPPTTLTSKRELYPQSVEKGSPIQLKYLKNRPKRVIIDVDRIKEGTIAETEASQLTLILIPLIASAVFIIGLLLLH